MDSKQDTLLKEKGAVEEQEEEQELIVEWSKADIKAHERRVVRIITAGILLLVFWWRPHRQAYTLAENYYNFSPTSCHSPIPDDIFTTPTSSRPELYEQYYQEYLERDAVADIIEQHPRNPAYQVKAYRGAVASENGICSNMGVDVLKKGGNAVDAAISTALCTGVLNMFSSGIGGGGFMVVRIPKSSSTTSSNATSSESEVWTINFRETAPGLSNDTMFQDDPMSARWGGLAIATPAEIRGLQEAHRRWGTIPWKELVEPSARLAAGWRVHPELERRIELFSPLMLNHPDWAPIFAPNGVLLKEGDWIKRTNYSRTLSIIAEQGPDAFYKGPIADAIVNKVHQTGGILSHEDLRNYQVRVERPLVGTYHGRKIYTTRAPGGGALFLQMFNVLENYDMSKFTPLTIHRLIEAMKFAFASRTKICDPVTTEDIERIAPLATKEYAREIVRNITDDRTHPPEYYNPIYDLPMDRGTSHASVLDQNGMAVALTTTVNSVFGALVLDPVTGIIFNDEMDDFAIPGIPNDFGIYPSPFNYPEPGKVPMSSTSPAILENPDGSFYASIGGSGGGRIFTNAVQVLLNLDWGLQVSEAVEFGRVHDQLYPLEVDVDEIYPPEVIDYLRELGHNVTVADIRRIAGITHVVTQKDGIIYAASDSRKNSIAAGY